MKFGSYEYKAIIDSFLRRYTVYRTPDTLSAFCE